MTKIWEQPIPDEYEKKIMEKISCHAGSILLDFGAGYGRYLDVFSKYFEKKNLYGMEIDKDALKELERKGYNCYEADPNRPEIPFENDFFDYIFTSNVIEHIPKAQYHGYLREFHRVLKGGGTLIIGTPNYPAKRFYDIAKAFKTGQFKYYFFDDPTHVNKLYYNRLENDLKKIFPTVELNPTYILLENKIKWINNHRNQLICFADKVIGICKK
ncbi:MAG TPA: class I SAM-dependent methyltransferase [Candidatus Bipolaricaulota bacterium]|nr:class I SAM-dependent methyltransferase [Candidatus Bipolaricaulota bacterium]